MNRIEISAIKRFESYFELTVFMRFDIPPVFQKVQGSIEGVLDLVQSYFNNYQIETISDNGSDAHVLKATIIESFKEGESKDSIQERLITAFQEEQAILNQFELKEFDVFVGSSYDGEKWNFEK